MGSGIQAPPEQDLARGAQEEMATVGAKRAAGTLNMEVDMC